jgi:hypothetical protein
MADFEIRSIRRPDFREVAAFLERWHDTHGESGAGIAVRKGVLSIERCLEWLLLDNPVRSPSPQYGFCVLDTSGKIRGLTLNFPNRFLAGDQPLLGLCSGSFFVEPNARSGGFYLFRKYLSSSGYAFLFATTCNANSSILWQKLGGVAVPDSESEYILPIRCEVVFDAFLEGRSEGAIASALASLAGRCASAMPRFVRGSGKVRVERSADWGKLSALSYRHRRRDLITSDRSASFLEWRYGPRSPNASADVCLVRDSSGHEGWFALGTRMLGRRGQIRGSLLLDAVWPEESMSFRDLLRAIYERAAPSADAIYLPPRPGLDYRAHSRWIVRRRLEAPRVWGVPSRGQAKLEIGALDLVTADGDSGWSNRYENDPASALERRRDALLPAITL